MQSDNTNGKNKVPRRSPLREGLDYYLEDGRYVFTEHFLLRRGYCCQSGCRHCPYGFRKPRPDQDQPPEIEES